jgi:hypothetical protein
MYRVSRPFIHIHTLNMIHTEVGLQLSPILIFLTLFPILLTIPTISCPGIISSWKTIPIPVSFNQTQIRVTAPHAFISTSNSFSLFIVGLFTVVN